MEGFKIETIEKKSNIEYIKEKADQLRVNMKDFIDIYGEKKVQNDISEMNARADKWRKKDVANLEHDLSYEETEKAELLIPLTMSEILGVNAETKISSKKDDYDNAIDGYTIINDLSNVFAYALDYTVTKDDNITTLEKKLNKVKKNVSKGHFSTIEYFESNDFKGEMKNVPRFIFPLKDQDIRKLENSFINNNYDNKDFFSISLKFFEYMQKQLSVFAEYTYSLGENNLSEKYESLYNLLDELYIKRKNDIEEKIGKEKFNDLLSSTERYIENSQLTKVLENKFN